MYYMTRKVEKSCSIMYSDLLEKQRADEESIEHPAFAYPRPRTNAASLSNVTFWSKLKPPMKSLRLDAERTCPGPLGNDFRTSGNDS